MAGSGRQSRRARREAELDRQRAAEAAERRRRLIVRVVAVVVAAAVVVPVAIAVLGPKLSKGGGEKAGRGDFPAATAPEPGPLVSNLPAAAKAAGCVLRDPPDEGRRHTTDTVDYRQNPPASGPHPPTPADDAAYVKAPRVGTSSTPSSTGASSSGTRPGLPVGYRGS